MSKNIYKELENTVLKTLKYFKEDLTVTDKSILKNYKGAFLYAYRDKGTSICLLDINKHDYSKSEKQMEFRLSNIRYYLNTTNKDFLHFDGEVLKTITRFELNALFITFSNKVLEKKKLLDDLNIELITFELLNLMSSTRCWKHYVLDSNNPALRRLRNYFDFEKIKKTDKHIELRAELTRLLK
jgi:hypothetical protein